MSDLALAADVLQVIANFDFAIGPEAGIRFSKLIL